MSLLFHGRNRLVRAAQQVAGWLEQIEIGTAIHATEFLVGDDGKNGADAVIEGGDSSSLDVSASSAVDQGRALA